jgi:hypothetical protein
MEDFAYWGGYNRTMLMLASKVVVLRIDGWATSKGVTAEIALAEELGIPIEYID